MLKTPRRFLARAKECYQDQLRPLHLCFHQAASFHKAGEKGTGLVTRQPQRAMPEQMLNFSDVADGRCGWKLLGAHPLGRAPAPRGWEQPMVTAPLGCGDLSTQEKGAGGWAPALVLLRCASRLFYWAFLAKLSLSELNSNCTTFPHFGVEWRRNCASANDFFPFQDIKKNVFAVILECCTHTTREEIVNRQWSCPSALTQPPTIQGTPRTGVAPLHNSTS